MSEAEPQNPELMEQALIAEGLRKRRKSRYDEWPGFLNNFYTQVLPENNQRWTTPREKSKQCGTWDKKHRDSVTYYLKYHSDVWLDQTDQEFYATVDRVIDELDTNGKIRRAIDRYCHVTGYDGGKAQDALEIRLIPVFARMVARLGYYKYDLSQ